MDAGTMFVSDQVNDMIMSGDLRLHAYSPVTLKVLFGMNSLDDDIDDLEQMIMDDQALVAEVLHMANSPFYYSISNVTTVRKAIVRLGMPMVKRIVIMVLERGRYRSWFSDLNTMLINLWTHVSTTAVSAQWLAQRLRLSGIEEVCFIGGLLHDIGKLAVICVIEEMRRKEHIGRIMSREALQEFITDNHCRIGYQIMKRWDIPDIYCMIAGTHHEQEFDAYNLPMVIVRLANNCSSLSEESMPISQLLETPEAQALDIDEPVLSELQKIIETYKGGAD